MNNKTISGLWQKVSISMKTLTYQCGFQTIVFFSSPKSKAHVSFSDQYLCIVCRCRCCHCTLLKVLSSQEFTFVKGIEVRIYTNKKRTWQHRIKQTIKNQRKTRVTIDKREYKNNSDIQV